MKYRINQHSTGICSDTAVFIWGETTLKIQVWVLCADSDASDHCCWPLVLFLPAVVTTDWSRKVNWFSNPLRIPLPLSLCFYMILLLLFLSSLILESHKWLSSFRLTFSEVAAPENPSYPTRGRTDFPVVIFLHIALLLLSVTRAISPAACVQMTKHECDYSCVCSSSFSRSLRTRTRGVFFQDRSSLGWDIYVWKVFSDASLHRFRFVIFISFSHCERNVGFGAQSSTATPKVVVHIAACVSHGDGRTESCRNKRMLWPVFSVSLALMRIYRRVLP